MSQDTKSTFNERILWQIKKCREGSESFQNPTKLTEFDLPLLLRIVLSTLSLPPPDLETCKDHLSIHFALVLDLQLAYISNNFSLLKNCSLLKRFQKGDVMESIPLAGINSTKSQSLMEAFAQPYEGDLPALFKECLDEYAESATGVEASKRAYNRSIPVIQSSGMGKSRLVEEMGKLVFTIPVNLRESQPSSVASYPPADDELREYFNDYKKKSDELVQVTYAILLTVLFDLVTPLAQEIGKRHTEIEGAKQWAEYLKEGQTAEEVGPRRNMLYAALVAKAKERLAKVKTEDRMVESDEKVKQTIQVLTGSEKVATYFSGLYRSCLRFCEAVVPKGQEQNGNVCLIYFDEAHALTTPHSNPGPLCRMSPYHNLGRVLEVICASPVFFIFLSTSPNLRQFPRTPYHHPSLIYTPGCRVFPPFTELPFDVFAERAFMDLALAYEPVSLDNVCTTNIMSHFGRPMWFVHHQLWKDQERKRGPGEPLPQGRRVGDVITLAVDKIGAHGAPAKSTASNLASIGVRVGLTFDSKTRSSRLMEAKLVESHMRIIYAIPQHGEYMQTGSPSEPLLAEAAARRLERCRGGIVEAGPTILADSCEDGFLARGERGELCGRLLVTIAHDLAVQKLFKHHSFEPKYHRPIPVLDFLLALFAQPHHNLILDAAPIHFNTFSHGPSKPRTLKEAFSNAYVSFSHFEIAQDSKVLEASQLSYSLIRGCAIQAKNNQVSIDAVIPIHMGSITDPITTGTTSAINLRFQNRKDVQSCSVDRSITVPNVLQPVISIVFELGEEHPPPPLVRAHNASRPEKAQVHVDDHHYMLIARGHGPETFNAVSEQSKPSYDAILGTGDVLEDFPRGHNEKLVKYFERMRPLQHGNTIASLSELQGQGRASAHQLAPK
ncbi:putative G2/mitotic-specific cyclin cdc13 [Rhizoctonia solani 123E]|uniref:Putative G2/mitotic-specific cyclin cdc13 n=1 Tax=Rhizoctonia solani 123E TaxID=1423351 RepID=A0A074RZG4_9AGAM|nr:putative G2/mitotic-specific cyclin cdc13 [Rhizoctonia solani 123E]